MCLVSKDTTIFTPYIVIHTTVTLFTVLCACAHVFFMCCTTPVGHFLRIRWKPKAIHQCRNKALVFNELLTVRVNVDETHQLRYARSFEVHISRVDSRSGIIVRFKSCFRCRDCRESHTNSLLIVNFVTFLFFSHLFLALPRTKMKKKGWQT